MYVITGASDGLGLALAKLLVDRGEKVVSLSRTAPKDKKIGHIACDLTKEGSINAAADALLKLQEPLKAFVNCAGIFSHQPLGQLNGGDLARTFTVNVIGPEILTSRIIERIKKDGADVINVSSTSGTKGNVGQSAYGASKWAMRGFSQVMREELIGTACRVISFCPGGMDTKIFKKSDALFNTKDWMRPADVAAFMVQILELPKNMEVSEVIVNRR